MDMPANFSTDMKRTLTIDINFNSSMYVSERQLHDHMDEIVSEIKRMVENMRYQSWHNKIYTNWEESEPVDIDFTFKD